MNTRHPITKHRRAAAIASMLITLSLVLGWLPRIRLINEIGATHASTEVAAQGANRQNILVIFGDRLNGAEVNQIV